MDLAGCSARGRALSFKKLASRRSLRPPAVPALGTPIPLAAPARGPTGGPRAAASMGPPFALASVSSLELAFHSGFALRREPEFAFKLISFKFNLFPALVPRVTVLADSDDLVIK